MTAKGPGRPRTEYPDDTANRVYGMAMIGCTLQEIVVVLGIPETSLTRHFGDSIEKGRESGKMSLRRAQWKAAEAGNTTMLVWLGKQWLAQSDKQEISGPEGGPIQTQQVTEETRKRYEQALERRFVAYHADAGNGNGNGNHGGMDSE